MAGLTSFGEHVARYGTLPLEDYLELCPWPLLVERQRVSAALPAASGPPEPAPGPAPPGRMAYSTRRFDERHMARAFLGALALRPDARVLAVRKGAATTFANMVTVGRAPNMDLVLEHDSVSKFHAFFSSDAEGWQLADAGSTNGTMLNDQRLEANVPARVRVGGRVVFGQATPFTFFPARDFHGLLAESGA